MTKNEFDYQVKLLLIGDAGVGKTCVLLRYTNDSFNPIVNATIGIDFTIKKLSFNKKRLKVQIWDTAGHESFRHITRSYYRGVDAVMFIYDVTNRSTLDGIRRWINDIMLSPSSSPLYKEDNVTCGDDNKVYKILIGSKCDLNSHRKISWDEGNALAKEFNMEFFEVSAKTNYNIIEAFSKLYDDVMQSKYEPVSGSIIASHHSLISSSDNTHHPRQLSSSSKKTNTTSLQQEEKMMMMSRMFQDHAVPVIIHGASSWWNKVKINGIYVPDCLHNYALRDHRALLLSLGLFWYRNISTAITTVLVYDCDDGTWYVKDGTTILASIKDVSSTEFSINNVSSTEFSLPHKILSSVWKERVRMLFFYWTTNSPNLKCIPYHDDDNNKQIRPDIIFKFKAKEEEDRDDDYVNMDMFVECCKHPESLGLTVPLFVRYCQVRIAVLELSYDEIIRRRSQQQTTTAGAGVGSIDIDGLEHIYQQREDVEDKCSSLLNSLAQQEAIKLLEIDRGTIIQAIELLIIDLNLLFDTLVNIKSGNFTMAKNCQATITELINTKETLELSTLPSITELIDRDDKNNDRNNDKNDDNNNSCCENNNNDNNYNKDLDENNIGQIIIDDNPLLSSGDRTKSQSKTYDFIRRVVTVTDNNTNNNSNNHNINKKYSWYIKHCEIKWVTIHEIKNSTDNDLEEKCLVTTGFTTSLQTTIGGSIGFTAGLFADLSSQLNIEMMTNSTTNQSVQKERTLRVSRGKGLKVEQEVIEGVICIERLTTKKSLFFIKLRPKIMLETFRLKKDSFRYIESDL